MPSNSLGLPLSYTHNQHNKSPQSVPRVLWTPDDPNSTSISLYRKHVNKKFSLKLRDSHELQRWSVTKPHDFWIDLYGYTGIIPPLPASTQVAYDENINMADIPPFFPGHTINYAENVLVPFTRQYADSVALIGLREGSLDDPEYIMWAELWELVRLTKSALVHSGIREHDVVAAMMSNSVWIVVVFLATASIGAYFTSISPDMGVSGCISRISQVKPKMLFSDVDFALRGIRHTLFDKLKEIRQSFVQTSTQPPLTIVVPTTKKPHRKDVSAPFGVSLKEFLTRSRIEDRLTFTRVPTSHPLVILYSSGTTGKPKCILSPHMSILNHKKIAMLHNSLSPSSVVFQYSSTSWVVWNVMMGHLSVGARLITYDGGALYPSAVTLLQICEKNNVTYWGTSPRYLLELEQALSAGVDPRNHDLSHLKMVTTTGATLTGPQMRWFYTAFPPTVHLSSIAGGTEIVSSWVASDPAGPLHENEMQMWALGHDCDIADGDSGESLIIGRQGELKTTTTVVGELVCRKPLASQPVGFWKDTGNKKYREAYFERFPLPTKPDTPDTVEYLKIWAQHDITSYNPVTRGIQITARSDSTLNPSGIRFGPSEIYSILSSPSSSLKDTISDALCVGRKRQGKDKDETVFLFLVPQKGHQIDDALIKQVKDEISRGLSQRHVPKFIIGMPAGSIPYTVNGKKVEVMVKKIISGDVEIDQKGDIVNGKPGVAGALSTITNPECLALYAQYKDIEREKGNRAKL